MSWHRDHNGEHHHARPNNNTREFNPGPATTSRRRLNFYGRFRRAAYKPWQTRRDK